MKAHILLMAPLDFLSLGFSFRLARVIDTSSKRITYTAGGKVLYILSTDDAKTRADEIAGELAKAYPDLQVLQCGEVEAPPLLTAQSWPRWDDLLVVVFGTGPLPAPLQGTLSQEVSAASAERRNARILPISTLPDLRVPPAPLDAIKALPCLHDRNTDVTNVVRRVGVLLGLWLRGSGKKFFVSYRESDGREVAKQLVEYLKRHGYPAWLDAERLDGGQIVQQAIEKHVAGADMVLLLDTPQVTDSKWIKKEIDAAIHGFVPIFPLVLRPAAGGLRKPGSSFLALRELYCHELEVTLGNDAMCVSLSQEDLNQVLVAIEQRLLQIVRNRMKLPSHAREAFERVHFSWSTLDQHRQMYESTRKESRFSQTRMLAHCSVDGPTFHRSVKAFQSYHPAAAPAGGSAGTAPPRAYNFKLFLYDEPVPEPNLEEIAEHLRLDEDPLLRLVDLTELTLHLETFRRPQAA